MYGDPLPQKGYWVAGADTSCRQRHEWQSLCPPLDFHTTTGQNCSIFWDTDLIERSHQLHCVYFLTVPVMSTVITSTYDLFRKNGSQFGVGVIDGHRFCKDEIGVGVDCMSFVHKLIWNCLTYVYRSTWRWHDGRLKHSVGVDWRLWDQFGVGVDWRL